MLCSGIGDESVRRILFRITQQLKKGASLRREAYLLLTSAGLCVALVLGMLVAIAGFVLPFFAEILATYQVDHSASLRIAIQLRDMVVSAPFKLLALLSGATLVFALVLYFPTTNRLFLSLLSYIPGLGLVLRRLRASRSKLSTSAYLRSSAGFDLATQAAPPEAGRVNGTPDMDLNSPSGGIAEQAETTLSAFVFAVVEAASVVILISTLLVVIFAIILPLLALVPSVILGGAG